MKGLFKNIGLLTLTLANTNRLIFNEKEFSGSAAYDEGKEINLPPQENTVPPVDQQLGEITRSWGKIGSGEADLTPLGKVTLGEGETPEKLSEEFSKQLEEVTGSEASLNILMNEGEYENMLKKLSESILDLSSNKQSLGFILKNVQQKTFFLIALSELDDATKECVLSLYSENAKEKIQAELMHISATDDQKIQAVYDFLQYFKAFNQQKT